jgi:hypothetical protein
MPLPPGEQLEVVLPHACDRGQNPRPVTVELAVGVAENLTAGDHDGGVAVVIVLPGVLARARPARVVLPAVHFDEGVR